MGSESPTSGAGDGCADLSADFGFSLMALAFAYRTAVSSVLEGVPQGARGYQALAAVVDGDGPSQLALAGYLRVDRTVMTYLIDDLVAAGLVERRLDPADRRRRRILATDHGAATLRGLRREVGETEERLLRAIAEEDRQVLRDLLGRVARGLTLGDTAGEACDVGGDVRAADRPPS